MSEKEREGVKKSGCVRKRGNDREGVSEGAGKG